MKKKKDKYESQIEKKSQMYRECLKWFVNFKRLKCLSCSEEAIKHTYRIKQQTQAWGINEMFTYKD